MKKILPWVYATSVVVLLIDWGIIGLKIMDGEYEFFVELYIALACLFLLVICTLYKCFGNKSPHCGKARWTNGKYCSYCGKEIDK